ncbi:MAG: hypothetical protein WED34_18775 [Planctomycetales bacterium]
MRIAEFATARVATRLIPAWLLSVALLGGGSASAQEAGAHEPRSTAKGPLAELPSPPGPHMAKIKALGSNEWVALGAPAADPKWGAARGRSWSSTQPVASNLGGMFIFAEGVHAFVKPDGHYMNDLFFYDINAHRWICVYPGIDTRAITRRIRDKELTVNGDGVLVDAEGEPVPPLLIHAYGYLGYDPERQKFLTFGGQFANYFTIGERGVFAEANRLFQEQRRGKGTKPLSPFFYDVATGKWEVYPVDLAPGGQPYGANVMTYVDSKRQFWYGGTDGVWFLDQDKRTWVDAKPQGTPPTGIDHCVAYDPKRDRAYYHARGEGNAGNGFLIYDMRKNEWSRPQTKGPAPSPSTAYESIFQFDAANDRLVILRWKGGQGSQPSVYAYHPETNTWEDPLPLPAEVIGATRDGSHGGFDPATNAFYCHFAGDSGDGGTIWAYRYKKK